MQHVIEVGSRQSVIKRRAKGGFQFGVCPRVQPVAFEALIALHGLNELRRVPFDRDAAGDHRRYLVLLLGLPVDEPLDIRVVGVQDYHLCRASGCPAALYRRSGPVEYLQEGQQA